jgi:hypothetical protein
MADDHIEALGVVPDSRGELNVAQLRQMQAAHGRAELQMAQFLELTSHVGWLSSCTMVKCHVWATPRK